MDSHYHCDTVQNLRPNTAEGFSTLLSSLVSLLDVLHLHIAGNLARHSFKKPSRLQIPIYNPINRHDQIPLIFKPPVQYIDNPIFFIPLNPLTLIVQPATASRRGYSALHTTSLGRDASPHKHPNALIHISQAPQITTADPIPDAPYLQTSD